MLELKLMITQDIYLLYVNTLNNSMIPEENLIRYMNCSSQLCKLFY